MDTPQRTREGANLEGIDEEEADIDTRAREGVPPCTPGTVLATPGIVSDRPDILLDTLDAHAKGQHPAHPVRY